MSSNYDVEYIEHEAVVTKVNPAAGSVEVRINDADECGSCPASALCKANGSPANDVVVRCGNASSYKVNDIVTVRGTEQLHRKALRLAVVLPSVAMIAIMVLVFLISGSQLFAAVAGLAALVVFYVALYAARNKIAHEFAFEIVGKPGRMK